MGLAEKNTEGSSNNRIFISRSRPLECKSVMSAQETQYGSWIRLLSVVYCTLIHSPWMGDIVDSGIGLSYWSASLCNLAGRYDNPMPELTLFDQSVWLWIWPLHTVPCPSQEKRNRSEVGEGAGSNLACVSWRKVMRVTKRKIRFY